MKLFRSLLALLVLALLAAACEGSGGSDRAELSGATLYVNNCAACHGDQGEGDGPVGAALAVQVPNLRTLRERNGGSYPADAVAAYIDGRSGVAAHGERLMPVWGDDFSVGGDSADEVARKIDALVAFVATLQY